MFESDLVETLASLRINERRRLFNYLESGDGIAEQRLFKETIVLSEYIFSALDSLSSNLSKEKLWKSVASTKDINEGQFEIWRNTAVLETESILKNKLKKRISTTPNDLSVLIKSLSEKERVQIIEFLDAGDFLWKEPVLKLVNVYCKAWTAFEESLSEKEVYNFFFGKENPILGKLSKTRTQTLKVIRRFLAMETAASQMSEIQELVWLQKYFQERENWSQYNRIRNTILRKKNEWLTPSTVDLYQYFLSEAQEYDQLTNRNELTNDQNLLEVIHSLDEYYLIERLWFTCQLLNLNKIAPLALPPQSEWLYFDQHSPSLRWFFEKPLGKLFTQSLAFLKDEAEFTESEFIQFIQLLREHEHQIGKDLVRSFEVFAINYGIRCANKGKNGYAEIVFDLQKRRAETDRIYSNNVILAAEFQSIATLGLRLGQFEWVREFIEKNKERVSGSMPSVEYYNFCFALYLYNIHELLSALHILMNSDFEDLACKMAARILEVKILCELELSGQTKLRVSDQLDARIEAGILFFFRLEDVPQDMRRIRKRFMDFMKKIIRAKENRRWNILEKIRKEVETIDFIAERQWLLKIIDQYLALGKKK